MRQHRIYTLYVSYSVPKPSPFQGTLHEEVQIWMRKESVFHAYWQKLSESYRADGVEYECLYNWEGCICRVSHIGTPFCHGYRIANPQICYNSLSALQGPAQPEAQCGFWHQQRLHQADDAYVKHFVGEARSIINLTSNEWNGISGVAGYALRRWLDTYPGSGGCQSTAWREGQSLVRLVIHFSARRIIILELLFSLAAGSSAPAPVKY